MVYKNTNRTTMMKLCPIVEIDGAEYVALAVQITGIDCKILGQKVCDLSYYRSEIISAVDFIISGV